MTEIESFNLFSIYWKYIAYVLVFTLNLLLLYPIFGIFKWRALTRLGLPLSER
jgi:hypothetical protein